MLLEGKKMFSVYAANLFWRNHSVQLRKYHSYFGIPLILEVCIICRADQKTFLKNPQINIKFLFNMVDVIGFWKTKEQSVTLAPNPKASGLSGVGNPETSWHKPYFISELEHHPESRPCTKALSIFNVSKAGSKE